MDHFTLSLAVGAVAGTLDIIPMIFQRLPLRSCLSAFFIYFFAAVIVFYSNLPYLPWWADGMAVTLMLMIPVLFTFVDDVVQWMRKVTHRKAPAHPAAPVVEAP